MLSCNSPRDYEASSFSAAVISSVCKCDRLARTLSRVRSQSSAGERADVHLSTRLVYQVRISKLPGIPALNLTYHSYHGYHGHVYPSSPDSCVIGLCTGLLCAAAVSSSRSIGELIPVAAETVVVALRLGLCVASVRDIVAPREQTSSSWCVLLSGIRELEARNILDKFSFQWVGVLFCTISSPGSNNTREYPHHRGRISVLWARTGSPSVLRPCCLINSLELVFQMTTNRQEPQSTVLIMQLISMITGTLKESLNTGQGTHT